MPGVRELILALVSSQQSLTVTITPQANCDPNLYMDDQTNPYPDMNTYKWAPCVPVRGRAARCQIQSPTCFSFAIACFAVAVPLVWKQFLDLVISVVACVCFLCSDGRRLTLAATASQFRLSSSALGLTTSQVRFYCASFCVGCDFERRRAT